MPKGNKGRRRKAVPLTPKQVDREIARRMGLHHAELLSATFTVSMEACITAVPISEASSSTLAAARKRMSDDSADGASSMADNTSSESDSEMSDCTSCSSPSPSEISFQTIESLDDIEFAPQTILEDYKTIDPLGRSVWSALMETAKKSVSGDQIPTVTINIGSKEEFKKCLDTIKQDLESLKVGGSKESSDKQETSPQGTSPSNSKEPVKPCSSKGEASTASSANKPSGSALPGAGSREMHYPKKVRRVDSLEWRKRAKREGRKHRPTPTTLYAAMAAKDAATNLDTPAEETPNDQGASQAQPLDPNLNSPLASMRELTRPMSLNSNNTEVYVQYRPRINDIIRKICGNPSDPLYATKRGIAEMFYDPNVRIPMIEYYWSILGPFETKEEVAADLDILCYTFVANAANEHLKVILMQFVLKAIKFRYNLPEDVVVEEDGDASAKSGSDQEVDDTPQL